MTETLFRDLGLFLIQNSISSEILEFRFEHIIVEISVVHLTVLFLLNQILNLLNTLINWYAVLSIPLHLHFL